MSSSSPIQRFGRTCRTVASLLIAGFYRRMDDRAVEERLAARPLRDQVIIVGGVLLALFIACLMAAQFGWVGLGLLFVLVVVLVR